MTDKFDVTRANEKPESLIYMDGEVYAERNAFISGFAYGRMTTNDSEMSLHWWMRGYTRDPWCEGEPANILQSTAALQAKHDALQAENGALREALEPSGATKAAYIGEFTFMREEIDEHGEGQAVEETVPWTTIKEIMAAIKARALLDKKP